MILDTFKSCFCGEPNYKETDESYVSKRLKELKQIAKSTHTLVMLIHHHGWTSGRASGSHAFWAVPDAIFDYHRNPTDTVGTLVRIGVRGNNEYAFKPIQLTKIKGLLQISTGIGGVADNALALFPSSEDEAITLYDFIGFAQEHLSWEKRSASRIPCRTKENHPIPL